MKLLYSELQNNIDTENVFADNHSSSSTYKQEEDNFEEAV